MQVWARNIVALVCAVRCCSWVDADNTEHCFISRVRQRETAALEWQMNTVSDLASSMQTLPCTAADFLRVFRHTRHPKRRVVIHSQHDDSAGRTRSRDDIRWCFKYQFADEFDKAHFGHCPGQSTSSTTDRSTSVTCSCVVMFELHSHISGSVVVASCVAIFCSLHGDVSSLCLHQNSLLFASVCQQISIR